MPQNNTENIKKFYEVQTQDEWADVPGHCTINPKRLSTWRKLWDKSFEALTDGAFRVSWSVDAGLEFFDVDTDGSYEVNQPDKDQEYFCTLNIYGKRMGLEFGPKHGGEFWLEFDTPEGWYR